MLYANEGVHTLEGGILRRKRRRSRRPGLPIEPAILFYPKFALEIGAQGVALLARLPQAEGAGSSAVLERSGALRI